VRTEAFRRRGDLSEPVSRWAPQFNKDALISTLEGCGLFYFFMGRELGGRTKITALLIDGEPDYAKMAGEPRSVKAV
jgi:hypothetical protein